MRYSIQRTERSSQVLLQGDLTAPVIPELQDALKDELRQGVEKIVFDLNSTEILDSSGICLLIATANSLTNKNGKIQVLNVSQDIFHLLKNMRLAEKLNVSGC
jgi:anti-anti-sigma factor